MKNTPLTTGIIVLVIGLIGVVFSIFSVIWMWVLIILGIIIIGWTAMSKKNKSVEDK